MIDMTRVRLLYGERRKNVRDAEASTKQALQRGLSSLARPQRGEIRLPRR